MSAKDFTVTEDVWIGNVESRPIDPASAEAGSFRLKAGTKITSEKAIEFGLMAAPKTKAAAVEEPDDAGAEEKATEPAEDKAAEKAPNKARKRTPRRK